jgi:site-specific DNA recombinase
LSRSVQPTESLFREVRELFKDLCDHRLAQAETQSKVLAAQSAKVERPAAQFLERIVDASVPSVIHAYEQRLSHLGNEKHVIREQMEDAGRPANSCEDSLGMALAFLSNR